MPQRCPFRQSSPNGCDSSAQGSALGNRPLQPPFALKGQNSYVATSFQSPGALALLRARSFHRSPSTKSPNKRMAPQMPLKKRSKRRQRGGNSLGADLQGSRARGRKLRTEPDNKTEGERTFGSVAFLAIPVSERTLLLGGHLRSHQLGSIHSRPFTTDSLCATRRFLVWGNNRF